MRCCVLLESRPCHPRPLLLLFLFFCSWLRQNRNKLANAQAEYDKIRAQLLEAVATALDDSNTRFEKLLMRLMQFEMQYYKEAHARCQQLEISVSAIQACCACLVLPC